MRLENKITINIITIIASEKALTLIVLPMFDSMSKRGNAEIIINTIATNSSPYSFLIGIMLFVISHHSRLH